MTGIDWTELVLSLIKSRFADSNMFALNLRMPSFLKLFMYLYLAFSIIERRGTTERCPACFLVYVVLTYFVEDCKQSMVFLVFYILQTVFFALHHYQQQPLFVITNNCLPVNVSDFVHLAVLATEVLYRHSEKKNAVSFNTCSSARTAMVIETNKSMIQVINEMLYLVKR